MWRYDAGRRAASPEELPATMHLQWVRELAPPKPAWPKSQDRLQFDASYEPVVGGKTIFIGSMVSDSVTAYDTETGTEKWRFYTDGPVRFSPVVYKNKLYFASDDGYLYCLDARNGSLLRRFLGGPTRNKVLGNDRLISMWPMRGGPVLYEEKIYFAAGIWPFMGTFIYAVDAETGNDVWTNSGSGATYLMQSHSSPAFAGVAPQGYLVATEDKLLVSGGRSVPAAYDRGTGRFLYYHLNAYSKTGACEVMTSGNHFFNRGSVYKLSDGKRISWSPASVIAGDVVIAKKDDAIVAYRPELEADKAKELWQTKVPSEFGRIHLKAGRRLYGSAEGKEGIILAIDIPTNNGQPKISWRAKVDGQVWTMLAADDKLFVITLEGSLYCFGDERTEPKRHALEIKPLPVGSGRWRDEAKQVLETTGEGKGYCLLLGLGTGELLYQLVSQSQFHIVALDPDSGKVAAIRRRLDEAGQYGTRVAVHTGDIMTMRLPPYMANLVVVEDLMAAGFQEDGTFVERLFHSLRPYGGTACFVAPQRKHRDMLEQAIKSKVPSCTVARSGWSITLTRDGPLTGSADWTHQYGDSANTVMSADKRVKAPLGLLWFGGPSNDKILPRHGHGPSPQVVDGRLFIEGRDMLRAADVYTGRLLWERDFQDLGKYYDNTSHQPGANKIGSNYVSVSDAVYLVYGDKIHVLDPATGRTMMELSMQREDKPRWGTIMVWEDLLLATASPISVPLTSRIKLPENAQPVIDKGADWQYLAGAHPNDAWTQPDFDTGGWKTSTAGFGYGDRDDETVLKDMEGHYSAVYIRKSFSIPEPENVQELGLAINYDDAFIAYLNGGEILRVGVSEGRGAGASGIDAHEARGQEYFKIDNYRSLLRKGKNVLAIEGHNQDLDSSDFTLDPYLLVLRDSTTVNDNGKHAGLNTPGVTVNADYASGSKTLIAMDRHSGKVLWKRDAEYSFRHNAIAVAANKVFCIDGMSIAVLTYLRRRGLDIEKERTLYALDARTGELLWKTDDRVFGTWLGYSVEHDVLLQAGSRSKDRARDEVDRGMAAHRGTDGKVLWRTDDRYKGPPILYHDRIITQTGGGGVTADSAAAEAKVFDLLTGKCVMREHPMTGETLPWTWVRFKGCDTAVASENLLTFRSASGAFVDFTQAQGTASIGGFRSGCTSNLIVANGVLNAPDYTRTCVCGYQNQVSLALVHMPGVVHWTVDYYLSPSVATPVKQVGINFGAPGNHYAENGMLWLEFPSVGGPSPDVPVRAKYENPQWFHYHSSHVEGRHNWIAASGVLGLREVRVRMFIQPGTNPSEVDAFDKHIEKIPVWSEDQIQGVFERPRPYTVRLYFAETDGCGIGQRLFNISLQDRLLLENFDIVKEADGPNRSVVKEFKGIKVRDDLILTLTPMTTAQADPVICGIEIIAEGW
jgi:outer membrane protein assembly factor BamB